MTHITYIIDDERTFAEVPGLEAVYLRNSADACAQLTEMLQKKEEATLMLDHDLGEDDTIGPFVDILLEAAFNDPQVCDLFKIFVHTQNPVGADNIMRSLERYGFFAIRIPLPELVNDD